MPKKKKKHKEKKTKKDKAKPLLQEPVLPPKKKSTRKPKRKSKKAGKKESTSPRVETMVEGVERYPELVDRPSCQKCGKDLDPFKAQVTGKKRGSWRCNECNTRSVQLSRLPAWQKLRASFKDFSAEQVTEFWKDAKDAHGAKALKEVVDRTLLKRKVNSKESSKGGSYLPLGVYKKLGYNTKRIKKYCKDTKHDDVAGTCYNVKVLSDKDSTLEETELRSLLKVTGHNKDEEQEVSEDGGDNSDSGKAKDKAAKEKAKKDKEEKAEKKKTKDEAEARKEAVKLERAAKVKAGRDKSDATKILSKIVPAMCLLENELKSSDTKKLPTFAVTSAKEALSNLNAVQVNAQNVLKKGDDLNFTLDAVTTRVKAAQTQQSFLASMLAAARAVG